MRKQRGDVATLRSEADDGRFQRDRARETESRITLGIINVKND